MLQNGEKMIEFFIFATFVGIGIFSIKGYFRDKKIMKIDPGINDWVKI